jgi:hypothetical protein
MGHGARRAGGMDTPVSGERLHAAHRATEQAGVVIFRTFVLHAFLLAMAFSILARRRALERIQA